MKQKFKQDKGVAGLTMLLSVIVMLFIIGFLVMVFSLMGSNMRDATYTSTTATATNETLVTVTETGEDFTASTLRDVVCTLTVVHNATGGEVITAGNYTQTNCNLKFKGTTTAYNNTNWNVTYSYVYKADNTATDVMNDTYVGIAGVTDWFEIFIVISAMVVLILLTVIIITAIRGSGLIEGGAGSTRDVGTA